MTEMNINQKKQLKSAGSALRRTFYLSVPTTMVLAAAVAAVFAIALDGCSSKSKNDNVSTTQGPGIQSVQPAVAPTPQPTPAMEAGTQAVTKKPAVRKAATLHYNNPNYGISFRYPGYYKLQPDTKEKEQAGLDSASPDPVPTNFGQPGGETIAMLKMPNRTASSLFKVSVNKDVSAEQCGQFASPAPSEVETNLPVDSNDSSVPTKTNVRGVEFVKVENATDQSDVQYYHHFEPGATAHDGVVGTCYEFALGIQETPNNTQPVDYLAMFDRMQRILATVKIKPEPVPTVTASVPAPPVSATNPQ